MADSTDMQTVVPASASMVESAAIAGITQVATPATPDSSSDKRAKRRKTSVVWELFEEGAVFHKCKKCNYQCKAGQGTQAMRKHLQNHHGPEWGSLAQHEELKPRQIQRQTSNGGVVGGSTSFANSMAAIPPRRRSALVPQSMERPLVVFYKRPPAWVGDRDVNIETPALLVDLDAMDHNMQAMINSMEPYPHIHIRPHAKSHKTPEIAKLQIETSRGRIRGITVQKVCEAEAMVDAGILDILVSNEIVGDAKLRRLVNLVRRGASITVVVDDNENATALSNAAVEAGVLVQVLVEMDVGQQRCGVADPLTAASVGEYVSRLPGLVLKGLQCYHGAMQHVRAYADRKRIAENVAELARQAVDLFRDRNLNHDVVTGGGTGSYLLDAASGVFTEVQPGSYVFMDVDYSRNQELDGQPISAGVWQHSLFLLGTVISRRDGDAGRWAVLDMGLKAMSVDSGPPAVHDPTMQLAVESVSDEHLKLVPTDPDTRPPPVGAKLRLVPGHCDPTTNHHDFVVGVRRGMVEHVWCITGRNPGY